MTDSPNVKLVRSIYTAWERGDFGSTEWAHPEIEFVIDGEAPSPGSWIGLAGMAEAWGEFLSAWEDDYRTEANEFREVDAEGVLVLVRIGGRGKASGVQVDHTSGAALFHVCDGKVAKLALYWDRKRAFADLGLAPDADAT